MKISVYDTYVTRKNGQVMHFDILVPDDLRNENQVHLYGKQYLQQKGEEGQALSSKECRFCHIEEASAEIIADIARQGYSIIEMQGCAN